jgi:hypothetical protein
MDSELSDQLLGRQRTIYLFKVAGAYPHIVTQRVDYED